MKQAKIVRELYRSNNPLSVIYNLKKENYETALKKLEQSLKVPKIKNYVINKKGNLPKTASELRSNKNLPNTDNLEGEIAYLTTSILNYSEEINKFIEIEKELQVLILNEKFIEARDLIQKTNNDICYSYWGLENLFSIEQKTNGTEGNWSFLKKINEEVTAPFTQFSCSLFSKKTEPETNVFQYSRDLQNTVNSLSPDECEYLFFKFGEFISDEITKFSFIINIENSSSIIDKYHTLIKVLFRISNNENTIPLTKTIINDLFKIGIRDERLNRILEFIGCVPYDNYDLKLLEIYDLYSEGKYSETLKLSKRLLIKQPYSIEIYETYIKTLLELKSEFVPTNISSFIDEILQCLYSIYDRNEDYSSSKETLLKHSICFNNVNFFRQLLSLVLTITSKNSHKNDIDKSYFIYSHNTNPNLLALNRFKEGIQINQELLNRHISLRINYCISKNIVSKLEQENIPKHKLNLYLNRADYYHDSQENLESLINSYNNENLNNYLKEQIILYLFKAFIKKDRLNELITILVKSQSYNKYFTDRIDNDYLIEYIVSKNYELDEISIYLPLYFHLHDVDYYYQYVTLEIYLNSISIDKPSEININNFINRKDIIQLLFKVCKTEILNNFYLIYASDDEVIEERIKILRLLTQYDLDNIDDYLEEIAFLNQKIKISKVIQTVNDGKISLNFSRIKNDIEYNLESSFNRFLKFKEFSDMNNFKFLDTSNVVSQYLSELKNDATKLQDASFVSFKSLFFEIVDVFLFSKEHGLDGDLSTRIRHGVLENQLRSIFASNNLIATKDTIGNYKDISLWRNICESKSYRPEVIQSLQKSLKNFSKNVDTITNRIINDLVQIQSNKHKTKVNGLFNYRFTDEYLWIIFKETTEKISNYEEFLNYVFGILTYYTEDLLRKISIIFTSEINDNFQQELLKLQDRVSSFLKNGEVHSEINQIINNTKTYIQNELYEISKWFKIANDSDNYLFDIETIIQTAIESINITNLEKITPVVNIEIEKNQLFERGLYYIDIFKILLENTLKHSGFNVNERKIEIVVKNEIISTLTPNRSRLSILIKNNLGDDINILTLRSKLNHISENWKTDLSVVNQEGGSGYQKIKRILTYDIQIIESKVNFNLKNKNLEVQIDILNYYNED